MNRRNTDKDGAGSGRDSESPVPGTSYAADSPIPSTSNAASTPVPSTSYAAGTPVPSTSNAAGSPIPSTSYAARTSPQPGTSSETRRLLESVMPVRDPSNDNHSSEEELEDINCRMNDPSAPCGESRRGLMSLNLREDSASGNSVSGLPEKRRWSDFGTTRTRRSYKMNRVSAFSERSRSDPYSESSDEEIQDLLANIESNIDNRPPSANNDRPSASGSPPTKAQNEEEKNEGSTPSQTHASGQAQVQVAQHLLERPCLDFEKMQQSSYSSGNFDYVEDEQRESP